jgi:hypothetical protein
MKRNYCNNQFVCMTGARTKIPEPMNDFTDPSPNESALEVIVGCACAAGPVFFFKASSGGHELPFAEVFPRSPRWLKAFAAWASDNRAGHVEG